MEIFFERSNWTKRTSICEHCPSFFGFVVHFLCDYWSARLHVVFITYFVHRRRVLFLPGDRAPKARETSREIERERLGVRGYAFPGKF